MSDSEATLNLLQRLDAGDRTAAEELYPLVQAQLRAIAARFFRDADPGSTLQPTAVLDDAFVRLVGSKGVGWSCRKHFVDMAAKVMRRILIDHARARAAAKRGGGAWRVTLSDVFRSEGGSQVDLLDLEAALEALALEHPRKAHLVELRFFGGLGNEEAARVLEIAPRTAEADWHFARAWIRRALDR